MEKSRKKGCGVWLWSFLSALRAILLRRPSSALTEAGRKDRKSVTA